MIHAICVSCSKCCAICTLEFIRSVAIYNVYSEQATLILFIVQLQTKNGNLHTFVYYILWIE